MLITHKFILFNHSPIRLALFIILSVCSFVLMGCQSFHAGNTNSSDGGPEAAQRRVEERLRQERKRLSRGERWAGHRESDYQSAEDIQQARVAQQREEERVAAAESLLARGELLLGECLSFALEYNNLIRAQRDNLRSVGGAEIINRSRFLPEVTYFLDYENVEDLGRDNTTDQGLRVSQQLFQFGRDSFEDVRLRADQRVVLFAYEDIVRSTLSEVRERFFTILLRQQQIEEREKLLEEFKASYERIKGKEKARRVLEADVLTTRLNVLNEEARINTLRQSKLREEIDFLRALGFPVATQDLQLKGDFENFEVSVDEAVLIALKRSTSVARARAIVEEQARVARQVIVDYFPDVDLEAGYRRDTASGGVSVDTNDGLYTVSAFGEVISQDAGRGLTGGSGIALSDEEGWFAGVRIDLPIFEGLERHGSFVRERSKLREFQHLLRDETNRVEASIRKLYQTILEARRSLELSEETVQISKERLRVQERLKELGRTTDDSLETFRTRFFNDQDSFFGQQIRLIQAQENLREEMRFFEPLQEGGLE